MRADVCIVGAGYTGLSAALDLAERGFKVVVLEAGRIGAGASGRNGGQLGTGQRRDQRWLETHCGRAEAHRLWELAESAKALAKSRIRQHAIACDLKPGILSVAHRADRVPALKDEVAHLVSDYGYTSLRVVEKDELRQMLGTTVYHAGALDLGAGHLHPLAFALGLARAAEGAGAAFHEESPVIAVNTESGLVETAQGRVEAEHVIVACNGYLGRLVPGIADYIVPLNNYIVASEPLGNEARTLIRDDVAVQDTRYVIHYYRLSADGRLLFGGGESYGTAMPRDIESKVRRHLHGVFPGLAQRRMDYAWGGTLAITLSRMPHVGRLGKRGYFAHGYSGHGVAMAGFAGALIAEAIRGTAERFDVMARLKIAPFPGGVRLRHPLRTLAMLYGQLRDVL